MHRILLFCLQLLLVEFSVTFSLSDQIKEADRGHAQNTTSLANLTVPVRQSFTIPNTELVLYYDFLYGILQQDARALFDAAVADAELKVWEGRGAEGVEDGEWRVEVPPLQITLNSVFKTGPTYQEVLNLIEAIQRFFPIPEKAGGRARYWAAKLILRGPRFGVSVGLATGSIRELDFGGRGSGAQQNGYH